METAVLVFPGSNREHDAAAALRQATGRPPHMIWHRETALPKLDLIVLPGGFSYGDYLRCGAMAAQSPVMRAVKEAAARGVPVLGVCNGFQMLCEAGLLPGALMRNASLKFICRDVDLTVENNQTIFTSGFAAGQTVTFPVAHGEGSYFADDATLDRIEGEGRVAFRYRDPVNGSARSIAGVLNEAKTVLGMMPHPENAIDPLHVVPGGRTDGRDFFAGLIGALH